EDIVEKAKRRILLGNPPGKKDSLGDSINWESLLQFVKNGDDVYFISGDGDYRSAVGNNEFSQYLKMEWENIKQSKIHYYKLIIEFFKDNFPELKITERDVEREAELLDSYYMRSDWKEYQSEELPFTI